MCCCYLKLQQTFLLVFLSSAFHKLVTFNQPNVDEVFADAVAVAVATAGGDAVAGVVAAVLSWLPFVLRGLS